MPDTQIFRGAVSDVPGVYTLPDSVEFVLKAVSAEYTDNGASGDWLPCVTVLSDSGHTIARAVDQAVKVTAGDDADVSWFPGVKHFPSAAPTTGGVRDILYMTRRSPAQSIPDNTPTLIEFGHTAGTNFYTNAAGDWSFDDTGAGDHNGVHILAQGVYLLYARLSFAAPGNYNKQLQLNAGSSMTNPIGTANELDASFDTFAATLQATTLFVLDATAGTAGNNTVQVSALQVSGGAVSVDQATLWIVKLGGTFP